MFTVDVKQQYNNNKIHGNFTGYMQTVSATEVNEVLQKFDSFAFFFCQQLIFKGKIKLQPTILVVNRQTSNDSVSFLLFAILVSQSERSEN